MAVERHRKVSRRLTRADQLGGFDGHAASHSGISSKDLIAPIPAESPLTIVLSPHAGNGGLQSPRSERTTDMCV